MASVDPQPVIELSLFGQKLFLKHNSEDPELVRQVVALVSEKIAEAEARAKGAAAHQVTLLALMDLAAEYIQAKARTEEYQSQMEQKSTALLNWIDAELG